MHLKPFLHAIVSACKEGNISFGIFLFSGFLSSAQNYMYTFIQKNKKNLWEKKRKKW